MKRPRRTHKLICCLGLIAASGSAFGADTTRVSQWSGERVACAECHAKIMTDFRHTGHGKAMEFGTGTKALDCGACHAGDLAKHAQAANPQLVTNPGKERPAATTALCL